MSDDREVRCYALLAQVHARRRPACPPASEEVRRLWLSQRDADDGCTLAAGQPDRQGRPAGA